MKKRKPYKQEISYFTNSIIKSKPVLLVVFGVLLLAFIICNILFIFVITKDFKVVLLFFFVLFDFLFGFCLFALHKAIRQKNIDFGEVITVSGIYNQKFAGRYWHYYIDDLPIEFPTPLKKYRKIIEIGTRVEFELLPVNAEVISKKKFFRFYVVSINEQYSLKDEVPKFNVEVQRLDH
jgi:hypothetical protein